MALGRSLEGQPRLRPVGWLVFATSDNQDPFRYAETLYRRDDALLYIAYVMLIWAAPIPADRWHCAVCGHS